MKRFLIFLVVAALVAAACGGDVTGSTPTAGEVSTTTGDAAPTQASSLAASAGVARRDPAPNAPIADLAAGLNNAGFALWRTQPSGENLVFSPVSIGHALLMARPAADDATGRAIDEAFGLPDGIAAHEAWNASDQLIADAADAQDDITVTIADRIWPQLGLAPDQDWIDLLVADHGVTTEALDLQGDRSGSRDIINKWVDDQTQGLIPELLPVGFILPETVLVLTDAVYFEAKWQTVFGKYGPDVATFTRLDGSTTDVEFMKELELGDLRGAGDGFVGAEIPYVGGDFSMLLIVPDAGRFDEVRHRLGQDLLDEIDATFTSGPYELLMPKWATTTALDLLPWLSEVGAAPGAYPAIAPGVFLGAAVHGADIRVDEQGTVAAAATALGFLESGPPPPELTVKADRPFLYVIRHRPTGLVLFAGQVTDPTA